MPHIRYPHSILIPCSSITYLQERRTQLFSATMTSKVAKLQRACLRNPARVEVASKYSTVDTLRQQYLFIPAKYKDCYLAYVLTGGRGCFVVLAVPAVPFHPRKVQGLLPGVRAHRWAWMFCWFCFASNNSSFTPNARSATWPMCSQVACALDTWVNIPSIHTTPMPNRRLAHG